MEDNLSLEYDVIIIGGGISGLAMANALKNLPLKVLLLERKPKFVDVNRGDTLFPHSLDFLSQWGVIPKLEAKGAVKSYKVSVCQNGKDVVDIDVIDPARQPFNYFLTLNHELIEQSLYETLAEATNVTVLLGSNVTQVVESAQGYDSVIFKHHGVDKSVKTKCLMSADGRDSTMRKIAGIDYSTTEFDHNIIILNSSTPAQYNFQTWFLYGKEHEMIIAPLPYNKVRISFIVKKGDTKRWMSLSEADFTQKIRQESSFLSNVVISKSESHLYEIKMSLASRFSDRNMILLGDSIHTVHPISGQGMALAISDAATLGSFIKDKLSVQASLTAADYAEIGAQFNQERRELVDQLQQDIARLGDLMISENRLIDMTRIFLFNVFEKMPLFERQIESMLQSEIEKF